MRRWLAAVSITMTGVLGLAGCGGGGSGQASQSAAPSGGGKQQVEVFSWWTGPGEADGLQAMKKIFEDKNP
ncbi:MAG: carbohydrate ABC transporter substrate-binding protein, partial [Nonomuraea sp.]|nr:carbohydrate ABC transporter substrate-binding protein [Nonomuraea sp.]